MEKSTPNARINAQNSSNKGAKSSGGDANSKSSSPIDLGSIIKSPLDAREYKALQLPNGLKVILISNLEVSKTLETYGKTCHLKKVFQFNKSYLGLDNQDLKVRCECQDKGPKKMDKSTSTSSGPNLDIPGVEASSEVLPLSMSEAMKAIKGLIYGESDDADEETEITPTSAIEDDQSEPVNDKSQEATAYLSVGAGWFNDPDEMQGMAHLVEHCLYLGSKNFPWPNQLFRLILPHDGYVNAYTAGDQTVYALSTSLEIFALSLEMLGDAIGAALLPRDLVSKEMDALDSEYSLRQEDIPKYFQLLASLAKKGHPLRKMDSGNKDTLRIPNFYKKVIDWRATHYCANYMTLALEAPLTIKEMEELAVKYFSDIPSSKLPTPRARVHMSGNPFDMDVFHRVYHVPSIYHSEFMIIHWALEPEAWKNLTVKPLEYLASIINHKGEGGLFQFLNYFGWSTSVIAGCFDADVVASSYSSIFSVYIDLTEEGFFKQDYILEAVFGYLEMLIRNEPSLEFYQECQRQQADYFHQRVVRETSSFAENISIWLQNVPAKLVLIAPHLLASFDKTLISKYTNMLRVDNCNIMIFSQKFLRNERMSEIEQFYKTPYASYEFPKGLCDKVERLSPQLSRVFLYPKPNLFLQEITCCGNQQKNLVRNGPLMVVKGKCSIYYKDEKFKAVRGQLPQAKYVFWLHSPIVTNGNGCTSSNTLIKLFASFLNEMIESRFSAALAAHHVIETSVSHGRLQLSLTGPSNQMPQITRELFKIVNYFEKLLKPVAFNTGKSSYVQELDNVVLDNRWYAWDIMAFLWSNHHQLSAEHKYQAENMDFSGFLQFVKAFKKKIYIVGHLYGFITRDQAFSVVQTVSTFMKSSQDVQHHEIPLHQCPKFPVGESIVRIKSKNSRIHTSVIINGYQFGNIGPDDSQIVDFLAKTMSDSAYYQLRTTEQLGYLIIVYHDVSYSATTLLIELVTQPKNYTTDYCNTRIDKFLVDFYVSNLLDETKFSEFLKGKPKVNFPLKNIQLLYTNYLLPNSETFRKMSIQVVGSSTDSFLLEKSVKEIPPPNLYYAPYPVPDGNEQPFKSKMIEEKVLSVNKTGPSAFQNTFAKEGGAEIYLKSQAEATYFKRSQSEERIKHFDNKYNNKFSDNNSKRRSYSERRLQKTDDKNDISLANAQKPHLTIEVKDIHEFKNGLKLYPNTNKSTIESEAPLPSATVSSMSTFEDD